MAGMSRVPMSSEADRNGTEYRFVDEVENKKKNTRREKRNPSTRLIKQQSPCSTSQNTVAGDLTPPSGDESNGADPRKLLLRRFR